eukprot:m.1114384 g.1114384  ORF g.1114384 m.1114384 type:complete len:161 (+) comp24366_c0_seq22:1856-2338(+)
MKGSTLGVPNSRSQILHVVDTSSYLLPQMAQSTRTPSASDCRRMWKTSTTQLDGTTSASRSLHSWRHVDRYVSEVALRDGLKRIMHDKFQPAMFHPHATRRHRYRYDRSKWVAIEFDGDPSEGNFQHLIIDVEPQFRYVVYTRSPFSVCVNVPPALLCCT